MQNTAFAPAQTSLEQGIALAPRGSLTVDHPERGRVVCRMPLAGNGNHIGTRYTGADMARWQPLGGGHQRRNLSIAKNFLNSLLDPH